MITSTIGDYVTDPKWRAWLQENRVELNAMSTPYFLRWLDEKFAPYAGKVVPPTRVLGEMIARDVQDQLRLRITDRVLHEADVEGQVERALREREHAILGVLPSIKGEIDHHLRDNPADLQSYPLQELALSIAVGSYGLRAA